MSIHDLINELFPNPDLALCCVLYSPASSLTVPVNPQHKYGYCLFTSSLIKIKEGVSLEMCILAIL